VQISVANIVGIFALRSIDLRSVYQMTVAAKMSNEEGFIQKENPAIAIELYTDKWFIIDGSHRLCANYHIKKLWVIPLHDNLEWWEIKTLAGQSNFIAQASGKQTFYDEMMMTVREFEELNKGRKKDSRKVSFEKLANHMAARYCSQKKKQVLARMIKVHTWLFKEPENELLNLIEKISAEPGKEDFFCYANLYLPQIFPACDGAQLVLLIEEMSKRKMTGREVSKFALSLGANINSTMNAPDLTDNTDANEDPIPLDDKEDQNSPPTQFEDKVPTNQESPSKRKAETTTKEQPKLKQQKVSAEKKEKQEDKGVKAIVRKVESPKKEEPKQVAIDNKEDKGVKATVRKVESPKKEEPKQVAIENKEEAEGEDDKDDDNDSVDGTIAQPSVPTNKNGKQEEEEQYCYLQKSQTTNSTVPMLSWKKVTCLFSILIF